MKLFMSLDDDAGFKVSLEISVSQSYLGYLSEDSQRQPLGQDLVQSAFVRAIPQLSAQLEQVHLSTSSSLLSSLSQLLNEKGDDGGSK